MERHISSTAKVKRMEELIKACHAQAKWHLEQYQNYNHYAKYYEKHYQSIKQSNFQQQRLKKNPPPGCGYYFGEEKPSNSLSIRKSSKRQRRVSSNSSKQKEASKHRSKLTKDTVEVAEQMESDGSEYEVDKGFKEFLRQSAEFRKERDAAKLKQTTNNKSKDNKNMIDGNEENIIECVEYVDILRKGPDGTILPPTASNRKELYEEKYGDAGTKILSLETALQWKFNTIVDNNSTMLWPTLPLRFVN